MGPDQTARHFWRKLDRSDPALWLPFLSFVYVAQTTAYFARIYHFNVVDDAYISFQYSRNWVEGNGLVFNPEERVEGYLRTIGLDWIAAQRSIPAVLV